MKRTFNVCGKNVVLDAYSWSTRYSWGHTAELTVDGVNKVTCKIRYLNRTWEAYQYQAVLKNAMWEYMLVIQKEEEDAYKKKLGLKRMSKKARLGFVESEFLKGLRKATETL